MIKNARQHRIARQQLRLLLEARDRAQAQPNPDLFVQAHITALETDAQTLQAELDQFERLRKGAFSVAKLRHLPTLGKDLISGRVAAGLSHKDLAHRLGRKEQVIQRWEASNYAGASLATLQEVADILIGAHQGTGGKRKFRLRRPGQPNIAA